MVVKRVSGILTTMALGAAIVINIPTHASAMTRLGTYGGGYNDPRYPPSFLSQEVGALKGQMLAYQAASIPIPQGALTKLENLLDVLNATTPSGAPARTLADVVAAMQRRLVATSSTASVRQLHGGIQPNITCTSWCYASVLESFVEPTSSPDPSDPPASDVGYYADLCGPGSSTVLIWDWSNNPFNYTGSHGRGYTGYSLYIAAPGKPLPQGEMVDQHRSGSGGEIYLTPYGNELNTINNQIGRTYYTEYDNPSHNTWVSHLDFDIGTAIEPMIIGANTSGLANWSHFPGVTHLIAVKGNNDSTDQIAYYDTASFESSGDSGANAEHTVNRTIVVNNGLYTNLW